MHGLKRPHYLPRRSREGRDGVGVAVVAQPHRAVVVRRRAPGRNEHEVALGIAGQHRPGVGAAGVSAQLPAPGAIGRVAGLLRNRIPAPAERTGPGIVGPHLAAGRRGAAVVVDGRPRDDQAVHHQRRRSHGVRLLLEGRNPKPAPEIDHAAGAEPTAGFAGAAIQRPELRLRIGDEDPPPARRTFRGLVIEPGRHAPAGEVAVSHVPFNLGIEDPTLPPSRGIQRDHPPQRRSDVHNPVDHQRGGLERGQLFRGEAGLGLAGAVGPGDLEPADVVSGDLIRR